LSASADPAVISVISRYEVLPRASLSVIAVFR
jgi:hypothetical protein